MVVFYKRAIASITRDLSKTVILLLLTFILGTFAFGGIVVRSAIHNTDSYLRHNMPPILTISFDSHAWEETIDWSVVDFDNHETIPRAEHLSLEMIRAFGEFPYVTVDYRTSASLASRELEHYFFLGAEEWNLKFFNLHGSSTTNQVQFELDSMNLIQGRQFEEDELVPGAEQSVAIISEALAIQNNLSIGSTFKLYYLVFFPTEDGHIVWDQHFLTDENIYAQVGMEFKIVGLFDMPIEYDQDISDDMNRLEHLNAIFVPNWVIEDVTLRIHEAEVSVWDSVDFEPPFELVEREIVIDALFILEDPIYINEFKSVADQMLPEFHSMIDLSNRFANISSSMETMQDMADGILYGVIIATILILGLLITLFLRERRHELGIYLALGEKKKNIVTQILLEVVSISMIGIILAVFTGHFISSQISQNMLNNELVSLAQTDNDSHLEHWNEFDRFGISSTPMTPEEMMNAFEISLDSRTIGIFYLVGIGTVMLSSVLPITYIIKLNPKQVLM